MYDALIIGGGPAGATAGILLAQAGWQVAILEQATFPRRKVCGEFISAPTLPLLEALGIGRDFRALAGPEIRHLGLFAGNTVLQVPMPHSNDPHCPPYGRALGREQLDMLLLDRARHLGADIHQPWKAQHLERDDISFVCTARHGASATTAQFRSRTVIAAHGSWETGRLPTQPGHQATSPGDLIGFKAYFKAARLAPGLMPLLVFPGGYGGMVETDGGRLSLSCCLRRDRLERIRQSGESAGDAVLRHIRQSCRGAAVALEGAMLEAKWLAAGPIRPGMRTSSMPGVFLVGNAAGEAHPLIADGISIAMQSAWLLCRSLIPLGKDLENPVLRQAASSYGSAWRRQFAPRIYASSVFAQLAIRPWAVSLLLPAFKAVPSLLSTGARLAGKTMALV